MYAGSTLKQLRTLDTLLGAHQKIDRLARRHLESTVTSSWHTKFPRTSAILQFEGMNGPDAIKRKTPAQDEPWHFYNPYDISDTKIFGIIMCHYDNLVQALREGNQTRASFEAAWLSHAIVDGLTPAHQYPYEKELQTLRKGAGIESRTTIKNKLVMPGDTVREKVQNNWKMWGDKGLLATHLAFEAGVALLLLPMKYTGLALPADWELAARRDNCIQYFMLQARRIADEKLYDTFYKSGWTPKLAVRIRRCLIPPIVMTVSFVWYCALQDAQKKVPGNLPCE